jgi:dienelactone hydrolase
MKEIIKFITPVMVLVFTVVNAQGAIKTQLVEYKHGDTTLVGYLAYNTQVKGKRPGILVVHDWMGEGEFNRDVSRKLAEMGYIVFSADIYGKGVRPKNRGEAREQATKYRSDRKLMRNRARAALDVLLANKMTSPKLVAALGYCFGGGVTLELARGGAPLAGAISFHGNLDTPDPKNAKNIKGKILVLHGADDPSVPPAQVAAFQQEMRDAGVDWQFVSYGGAVHAFTNPAAGNDNSRGAAYNEKADKRSWEAMKVFFSEIFRP